MKTRWMTMFALGVIGAIANPVSKQTFTDDNKNSQQLESIESQTKHEETTLNNGEKQKDLETISIPEPSASDDRKNDDKVEIIIQETVVSPIEDAPRSIDDAPSPIDDVSTLNNGDKQKELEIIGIPESSASDDRKNDDKVEIIIQETVVSPIEDAPRPIDNFPSPIDGAPSPIDDVPTVNNGDKQKVLEIIGIPEPSASDDRKNDDKVEIIIQETVVSPIEDAPRPIDNFPSPIDDTPRPIDDVLRQIDEDLSLIDYVPRPVDDVPSLIDYVPRPVDDVPSPIDYVPRPIDDASISFDIASQIPDGFEDDFPVNDIPFREAPMNTIQDEIMETAAGFVPTPLVFRRKQKPRRRFATRRHFKPNPFRRKFHFFYPHYGFYHPSSLRFY